MSRAVKLASWLCALLVMASAVATGASAQNAERLSQVKKLYVDSLGTGRGTAKMRQRLAGI